MTKRKRKPKTDKPFALFAGYEHQANGGYYDYRHSYSTLAEAKEGANGWFWYHVVDLRTMLLVAGN